jgi:hypothetical protein
VARRPGGDFGRLPPPFAGEGWGGGCPRGAHDINHIFLAFMGLVGGAIGIVLVVAPESRDFWVPPYFWVLIVMAAFELVAFSRRGGAPGTVVTMDARVGGFLLAVVLMVAIPMVSGSPTRLF